MIKTIVFDIGNVVWNYEPPCLPFHNNLAKLLDISPETYKQEYFKVYQAFETDNLRLLSWCQRFNPKINQDQINALLHQFLSPATHKKYLNQDVVNLIKNLKCNYTIGYLSNGENYFIPFVYHPLDYLFHFQLISSQIGFRKPGPLAYREIFKHVNCQPQEVVYIDDKQENIIGAKNIGLNAILFTGYQPLLADLSLYLPKKDIFISPTPTVHTK